ncbi:MAG: septation protein A [Pseudomonadota bacterium]
MKFLFDLFPVIFFFVAYKFAHGNPEGALLLTRSLLGPNIVSTQAPILLATAVAIVATFMQVGWLLARRRKVDTMLWVSLAIIVVFGGATLIFQNENFIKWKPTVLYWLFAIVLLGGKIVFHRNFIRATLEKQFTVPEPIWNKLNLSWAGFFTAMGFANLYFAFNFPTETWVNFKVFGMSGLMLVFVLFQSVWLAKYIEHPKEESQ